MPAWPLARRLLTFATEEDLLRWFQVEDADPERARFGDAGTRTIVGGDPILVRCPRCAQGATITFGEFQPGERGGRLVCRCAYTLRLGQACWYSGSVTLEAPMLDANRCVRIGPEPPEVASGLGSVARRPGAEPPLHLALFLTTPCAGHVLWAFNPRHLTLLARWIGARHRERLPDTNRSFASRLPTWMTEKKHRDEVLEAIQLLERLAASVGHA